ncbi:aspartate/glutamate racemase family protein [Myxococcus sp. CA039A]|uniref:aspartate/glutamate racemase family protein n=1 Tax=Myxococcus sp. CA039A TaxID=2741737 RepID=UPI00157BAF10|nr:aspartate/glutamate racemase family protein [Myxococcus sp. CA039A]NTX50276.1 aspartate/glutamate racemase family protein [Myxococcus sp. CA039A]
MWDVVPAPSELLGIVGGLGPLASAEFLKTIYEENPFEVEQSGPACVLLSDPNVPDRTQAIIQGQEALVARWLEGALSRLRDMGARRMVIACITMHHFLEHIPAPLRDLTVSLVDLTLDEVSAEGKRWLILSSQGTRAARVFERSERWRAAEPHLTWTSAAEQVELHDAIYRLKRHGDVTEAAVLCERLVRAHGVDGFIAGCTELHLVTRYMRTRPPQERLRNIDPLYLVANRMPALVTHRYALKRSA